MLFTDRLAMAIATLTDAAIWLSEDGNISNMDKLDAAAAVLQQILDSERD